MAPKPTAIMFKLPVTLPFMHVISCYSATAIYTPLPECLHSTHTEMFNVPNSWHSVTGTARPRCLISTSNIFQHLICSCPLPSAYARGNTAQWLLSWCSEPITTTKGYIRDGNKLQSISTTTTKGYIRDGNKLQSISTTTTKGYIGAGNKLQSISTTTTKGYIRAGNKLQSISTTTTKGYIRAGNKLQSISCLFCSKVMKLQHFSKSSKLVSTKIWSKT